MDSHNKEKARLYSRARYQAFKERDPEGLKAYNRRRYERIKANPEKYADRLARARVRRNPNPKPQTTKAERLVARARNQREYWKTHPDKYRAHLANCSAKGKAKRLAKKAEQAKLASEDVQIRECN
jgi:hypothetical protein